ncbi:hypothetical protein CEXT_591061 [Caerostris extrusa]|uniref:Uncharacterized protein n=1 Tax=Caerostris extrusa TaxID=172846 RepID=A0AAV4UUA2_CAEEX|nr:hypothetical protein CEXT_591061 [Caerostris extrusa]
MHGEACSMWRLFKRQDWDGGGGRASFGLAGVERIGVNIEGGWAFEITPSVASAREICRQMLRRSEQRDSVLVENGSQMPCQAQRLARTKG